MKHTSTPPEVIITCFLLLKFSTISVEAVSGRVQTTPDKCQNAALFIQLGLPSTLSWTENCRNLKTRALRFSLKTITCCDSHVIKGALKRFYRR